MPVGAKDVHLVAKMVSIVKTNIERRRDPAKVVRGFSSAHGKSPRDASLLRMTSQVHMQKVTKVLGLAKGQLILDAGCGDGQVSAILARHGYHVVACDRSSHQARLAHALARTSGWRLDVCVASLTNLPFRPLSFDSTCCLEVLEHIPDLGEAIRELQRVLGTGGILIVTIPALAHDLIYDRILLRSAISTFILGQLGYLDHVEDGHWHVHKITPSMVTRPLEQLGMEVVSFQNVSLTATYLETGKHMLSVLIGRSGRIFDRIIDFDLKVAKHFPWILGASWLIAFTNRERSQRASH